MYVICLVNRSLNKKKKKKKKKRILSQVPTYETFIKKVIKHSPTTGNVRNIVDGDISSCDPIKMFKL